MSAVGFNGEHPGNNYSRQELRTWEEKLIIFIFLLKNNKYSKCNEIGLEISVSTKTCIDNEDTQGIGTFFLKKIIKWEPTFQHKLSKINLLKAEITDLLKKKIQLPLLVWSR